MRDPQDQVEPHLETLAYASVEPAPPRPAMYQLVLTVLFGALIILLAVLASAVFLALIFEHAHMMAVIPFGVAAGLFYVGIQCLTVVVMFLLGKRPGKRWER